MNGVKHIRVAFSATTFLFGLIFCTFSNEASSSSSIQKYRYQFQLPSSVGETWVPVPQEHSLQHDISQTSLNPTPSDYYTDPKNGNQILFYGNNEEDIRGTYELISYLPTSIVIDPNRVGDYDTSSNLYKTYTRSETWIESDDTEIVQKAKSIVGSESNPFLASQKIFHFVGQYLAPGSFWVDGMSAEEYRNEYGALATYKRGTGSCQNYALLFVALCRAAGIPARTVHGINLPGDPPIENEKLEDWSHAWAEIYLPNYGWIPADPSYLEFGDIELGEIPTLRIILSIGNNIPIDPICTISDQCWYCGKDGKALFLGYPIPYGDLRFSVTSVKDPITAIKANGTHSSLSTSASNAVSIEIALNPGTRTGEFADWWIVARTPFAPPGDWYSYVYPTGWVQGINLCIQTGLFKLTAFEVLNMQLPVGDYTFYFGIDDPDGIASGPWWALDSVKVTVE